MSLSCSFILSFIALPVSPIYTLPHSHGILYTKAIHIRLHSNNINKDSGIEIPEAWIPTIRKHNSRSTRRQTYEGTSSVSRNSNEDRNAPITANQRA